MILLDMANQKCLCLYTELFIRSKTMTPDNHPLLTHFWSVNGTNVEIKLSSVTILMHNLVCDG